MRPVRTSLLALAGLLWMQAGAVAGMPEEGNLLPDGEA